MERSAALQTNESLGASLLFSLDQGNFSPFNMDISDPSIRVLQLESELELERFRNRTLENEVRALRARVQKLSKQNETRKTIITRIQATVDAVDDLHGDLCDRVQALAFVYDGVGAPKISDADSSVLSHSNADPTDTPSDSSSVGDLWGSAVRKVEHAPFVRPRRRKRAHYMAAAQRSLDATIPLSLSDLDGFEHNCYLDACKEGGSEVKSLQEMDEHLKHGELDDEVVFRLEDLELDDTVQETSNPPKDHPSSELMKNAAEPSDNCTGKEETFKEWYTKEQPRIEKLKIEIGERLEKMGCQQL